MMLDNKILPAFAKQLVAEKDFYQKCCAAISLQFSLECQRFRSIKNATELTTAELDTIGINAARNYLNYVRVAELPVSFQIVKSA